jgi:hypothetical protein
MLSFWSYPRTLLLALVLALVGLSPATTASAQDATIELDIFKAGFIIGGGGGHGVLYYKGHGYPLKVGGISLGATIGASKAELIGEVSNLSKPEDIAGTYTAVSGSAVLAGGVTSADLKNTNGVQLHLHGRSIGLELSLDLSGLEISLR